MTNGAEREAAPHAAEERRGDLDGKVALVTGATRGIGRAIALALGHAGATVVGTATTDEGAASITALFAAESLSGEGMRLDVRDAASIERVLRDIEARHGMVGILVNNAGVTRDGLFRKMERGAWDTVINTNLNSVFDVTQRFIEPMATRGWGRVINISSIVGRIGNFGQTNYAAAKAGLIGLTKALAREYARKGVTVNAIAPGFVKTRMLEGVSEKALQSVLAATPMGRFADPMEIGASVLFLASPAAAFVTGHVLDVNGGMAM
jgi:NAD(P)-dependent dehydrogenase (short-subunit alcohol dehydrogenase family)